MALSNRRTLPARPQRATAHLIFLGLLLLAHRPAPAQTSDFDLERYASFLHSTSAIDYAGLTALHPAGSFEFAAENDFEDALFSHEVADRFGLTGYEELLVERHGFVVTERFQPTSFGDAFWQIYVADLPVYISADALLHAVHMSYDNILRDIETTRLIPDLEALLGAMLGALPDQALRLGGTPEVDTALADVDVYLSVASSLLGGATTQTTWAANQGTLDHLLDLIGAEQPAATPLFSEACRSYDFSQFTRRGHYTLTEDLGRYFEAMIWLGRTELYLIAPETAQCKATEDDVRRQTLMSLLIADLIDEAGLGGIVRGIDAIIGAMVGEQDNTTLEDLEDLASDAAILDPIDFLDPQKEVAFQAALAASPFSRQRINSQVLVTTDLSDPDAIQPAGAFMLFGQRFIVDSFVTGHVVFAEVPPNPEPRMLPKSADVLFALGNDAALPVLEEDLKRFNYGPQLAALRYLIDGYDDAFWNETFYNGWLNAIRTLNPPADRTRLPSFMQTGAWWQKQMTTQLAGWAQLRHDNLLYAKQSYSGGLTCVYPYALVEPIPEFFGALRQLASHSRTRFQALGIQVGSYFLDQLEVTATTLELLAEKSRDGVAFSAEEHTWVQSMINQGGGSGPIFDGWYPRLFYPNSDRVLEEDLVVADIHTAPTDAHGSQVGWVVHAGTGPINLAVITAEVPGVGPVAFTGPVMSYYEHISTNFRRLTDEEWETEYVTAPSFRPDLANLYLADVDGAPRGPGFVLATGVDSPAEAQPTESSFSVQNYPNPFSDGTTITFALPQASVPGEVRLEIFDVRGRRLVDTTLGPAAAGSFAWRWDPGGHLDTLANGIYFCRVTAGGETKTTSLALIR